MSKFCFLPIERKAFTSFLIKSALDLRGNMELPYMAHCYSSCVVFPERRVAAKQTCSSSRKLN